MPKKMNQLEQELIDRVKKMVIGHSFFIEGVTSDDVQFLRRPLVRLGVGVKMVELACDEIYQCHGVRIWRLEGAYDEL